MEALIDRQIEIFNNIKKIQINFNKDSPSRKNPDYLRIRIESLENLWGEFNNNHAVLIGSQQEANQYFTDNIYDKAKEIYECTRKCISSYGKEEKAVQPSGEVDSLLSLQRTHFRAFNRLLRSIDLGAISEKWEIEDEIQNLQHKWNTIDELHIKIDNLVRGGDLAYEEEYLHYELLFKNMKKSLNQKLSSNLHIQKYTPKLEIPIFTGKYTYWPTFYDLFSEAIHNNNAITKAQKFQHLKSKVRGEAERLIQHLNISAENYDTAWDMLVHRYNNPHVLFSKHMELFLNQHNITKPTSYELKKLHDTSTECIHAIHNLGIDTTTWDPLLVHLLCKKLDPQTYTDYKESRKSPRSLPTFNEFMDFLEGKFMALEPLYRKEKGIATTSSSLDSKREPYSAKPSNSKSYYHEHKNHQVFTTHVARCPLCSFPHALFKCKKFINMSPDIQLKTITKHSICKNCLYKHYDKECTSSKRCKECNSDHNTILHEACMRQSSLTSNDKSSSIITPVDGKQTSASTSAQPNNQKSIYHIASQNMEAILPTVVIKVQAADGTYIKARALLDQAAQVSLVSENLVQLLGLKRHHPSVPVSVSGIDLCSRQNRGEVSIRFQSIYNDYQFVTDALIVSRVTYDLPNTSFQHKDLTHLRGLELADPHFSVSQRIDLLLHCDIYSQVIMEGLIKGPDRTPIAQQTRLGWIVSGSVKTLNCYLVTKDTRDLSRFWEIEDVVDTSASVLTEEDQFCEHLYQKTTRRLENGTYVVALPMKQNYQQQLGSSRNKAMAQFKQLENRLAKDQALSESYQQFMREYIALNHMRRISYPNYQANYLPHHGVLKLDSETTKLRVVFNASMKTSSGSSLNDIMHRGPNLQSDLQSLILNWRTYKYVIVADIEKMFRQILIRDADQYLQTIIWREKPSDVLQDYQLTTITYGMKAAPFLAMRTLKQLAKDEAKNYPLAASAIETSFYMDDLLTGHNCIIKVKQLQQELIKIFKSANMNLRKWASNTPSILRDTTQENLSNCFEFKGLESRKTLGLKWSPNSDCFTYENILIDTNKPVTKRQLLSEFSKIFDPLGWLSPLIIRAKVLFQNTWNIKMNWDDEVPETIHREWMQISTDFRNISDFIIPRYLGDTNKPCQLHAFCDASDKAYACVVYIVTVNDKGEYTSRLVAAKTKLAPLAKKISLPRLELCGALLLSQLLLKILESFSGMDIKLHAWSDSMIVLGWLHGDISRWKQFVANRVQQITRIVPASRWRHVRSEDNPADCATRGITKEQLSVFKLWWTGPAWITKKEDHNSDLIIPNNYQIPDIEIKSAGVHATLQNNNISIINELLHQHSSITKVAKIVGWILRFQNRARSKQNNPGQNYLLPWELNNSFNIITKEIQNQEFRRDLDDIKHTGRVSTSSKLLSLNPFVDNQGILRVGGRLSNANLSSSAKYPVILPSHSRLTELIINRAHKTTLHGGPRLTLSFIRNQYWIISGIRTVKRQLRQCVRCRRYSSENHQHIMGDLPQPRVTPSRPFTHTGVDFTGFVELRINKGRGVKTCKGYIAVFVCLSTKAIHLELVSDLSTPTFLAAFRRFCARRGSPQHMYSDNGTNFIGADRLLKKEYKEIVQNINSDFFNNIADFNIEWHFNAPVWPNAGGLWEAAVKSTKYHLKRVLGEQKLTYEEFATLLNQIEACLNSRPLCQLTENPDDAFLTPGHFLVGSSILSRPQSEPQSMTLAGRWQLVQTMNKHFWKRWSAEYLQQLQVRTKWRTCKANLHLDDVVLIKEDNLPPGKWALGRVQELHPGKDGFVRVVTLKTSSNTIKRPTCKLVPLPVREQGKESESDRQQEQITKQGTIGLNRTSRTRGLSIKNLAITLLLMFTTLFVPSYQQQTPYNISLLEDKQGLFFDKITNMQYVKDDWKLIVYYNMSTYWQSVSNIDEYIKHLQELCKKQGSQYQTIIHQLDHELKEIEHYNTLFTTSKIGKKRRGLINGVGYIASDLFGVLDVRFAEKYKEDLEKIASNEYHLQDLLRNQTSVIESEYNILRRNEEIMKKQYKFINERLQNVSVQINHVQVVYEAEAYIISSALAATIILNNLRRMQQTLMDTITDIAHGRIDGHFLLPEQLQYETNIISGHLSGDLMLPVDRDHIRDLYKLLKVSACVHTNYLIIEIKIPLLSSDIFELDRIISIPQRININQTLRTVPRMPYIAYNLNKDIAFLLTETDLQSCVHTTYQRIMCTLDTPIYDLNIKQSLCNIKLLTADTGARACATIQTSCQNQWTKLHNIDSWIFSCCEECQVRIFCTPHTIVKDIKGSGIISLEKGCTLKGETFSLYSHNSFFNQIHIQQNIEAPKVAVLNKIINTSFSESELPPLLEYHTDQVWKQIQTQINDIKKNSENQFTIHDVHHYSLLYVIVAGLLLAAATVTCIKYRRSRAGHVVPDPETAAPRSQPTQISVIDCASSESVNEVVRSIQSVPSEIKRSVLSVDIGTSPMPLRSRLGDS